MGKIEIAGVTKRYGGDVTAVDDVTLSVEDGEFLVLVGPSGCGKSTLLRMIAGLEEITEGSMAIGGHDVTRLAPRDRDIAMVFQNYSLYPHLTVRGNLEYGLKARRTPKQEIRRRVVAVAGMLGLDELLDRKPGQLSGGQRQRVAMGRAIVREPQAFLMDEPPSNLDAKLRVSMRGSLAQLHARLGVTTVYVTHDQVEAMTLGQRVAVLSDGRLQQVDGPQQLYRTPASLFVATFIGSPAMNVIESRVEDGAVVLGSVRVPLAPDRRPDVRDDVPIILGIRPEDFEDADFAPPELPVLEVEVAVLEELGSDAHVIFAVDAPAVDLVKLRAAERELAETTLLVEERALFNARVNPGTSARVGERLRLAVNPRRFYFFDPASGLNLIPRKRNAGWQCREGVQEPSHSRAAATAACPKLMPPSFGGTRRCERTRKPCRSSRSRVEASSRRFWKVPPERTTVSPPTSAHASAAPAATVSWNAAAISARPRPPASSSCTARTSAAPSPKRHGYGAAATLPASCSSSIAAWPS